MTFRALAIALLSLTSTVDGPPARTAAREEQVVFSSDDGRVLAGTLTLPDGAPPYAVALSLTGSGSHLRDGNRTPEHPYRPFRHIANALAARGIAMLRLDDRGIGGSTGDGNAATGDDVANDARAAMRWLRARADIDGARVALIGHSFGGEIAPLVAASDPAVAAVVLMGAPARNFRETMKYQNRYLIEVDPTIPAELKAAALERMTTEQERNVATSAEKWRPWSQDRDPLLTARKLRCPVLILQGMTDRAVPPSDATLLEKAIREGGNAHVTVRFFENVNHHFQRDPIGARSGYDRLPTQDLAPEFLDVLGEWLRAIVAR